MEGLNTTTSIEQLISAKIEELKYVDGINGDRELVTEVVRDTHTELQKVCKKVDAIKEDTQILRDFNGFFAFMKKYKGWWVVGIMFTYILASIGLDVTLVNIKNHLP